MRVFGLLLPVLALGCGTPYVPGRGPSRVINMPVTPDTSEQEVKFQGAGGFELVGTLELPAGDLSVRKPAILLISGSGPTDRNGNQGWFSPDTMKQFAKGLAAAGIASFRFDKRAVGSYQKKWPSDSSQLPGFFSWQNHVDDALAAFQAMKSQPQVDPTKCGVMGHSEGGLIALAMAPKAKPAVLVLASSVARPFDVVIHWQLENKLTSGVTKQLLADSDRISEAIKATGQLPKDVPKELAALYNISIPVYYQQICRLVPTTLAKAVACPTLVMNGQDDSQVDPDLDAKPLYAALPSSKSNRLLIVPLASHNYKPVHGKDEAGITGDVVPDAIEELQRFLVPVIGGKVPDTPVSPD